jgi:hypothetical protein
MPIIMVINQPNPPGAQLLQYALFEDKAHQSASRFELVS